MILLGYSTEVSRCVLLGLCRHPSQWAGAAFAARSDVYGLCCTAESWMLACLQELDIEGMNFSYSIALPHRLERAAFYSTSVEDGIWLEKCRCAMIVPTGRDGARCS